MADKSSGYKQIRDNLQKNRIGRGWSGAPSLQLPGKGSGKKGSGKGKGKGKSPEQRLRHISELKARTKCKKCGQVGHWAAECKNSEQAVTGYTVAGSDQDSFFCGMEGGALSSAPASPEALPPRRPPVKKTLCKTCNIEVPEPFFGPLCEPCQDEKEAAAFWLTFNAEPVPDIHAEKSTSRKP